MTHEINPEKLKQRIREINLKIIDLENKIRNAEGELNDFRRMKTNLERLLEEATDG